MPRLSDEDRLLSLVPQDGATIGNKNLCEQLGWDEEKYWRVRERILEKGIISKAPGRGGAVRRTSATNGSDEEPSDESTVGTRHRRTQEEIFFELVPENGSRITNAELREWLGWDDEKYDRVRERLVEKKTIVKGPGPGGTVRRAEVPSEQDANKPQHASERQRRKALFSLIPEDGSSISNRALIEELGWDEDAYATIRDQLVERELILKGGGPGGTVRRAELASEPKGPKPLSAAEQQRLAKKLLSHIPEDGLSISNRALLEKLGWHEDTYATIRDGLIEDETILKGGGPGGTIRRANIASEPKGPRPLSTAERQRLVKDLLSHIPADGSAIANKALVEALGWDEVMYATIRDGLVEDKTILNSRGPGGTVRRAEAISELHDNKPLSAADRQRLMQRPRIFIGSSVEGLSIAEHVQLGLDHHAECTLWSQGVFGLSGGTLDSLLRAVKNYEFAVLVLTPDDLVHKRDVAKNSPRDNVLFELGLFMGALGRERTYIVYCRDEKPDLPTDLAGVTPATFAKRADGNLHAAIGPVCTQIKTAINAAKAANTTP